MNTTHKTEPKPKPLSTVVTYTTENNYVEARPSYVANLNTEWFGASVEARGLRHKDYCTYELTLNVGEQDTYGDDEEPGTGHGSVKFRGEWEREAAVVALRWLADRLEELGGSER